MSAPTLERVKRIANAWKKALRARDIQFGHAVLLEALAAGFGFNSYSAMLSAGGPVDDQHFEDDAIARLAAILDEPVGQDARTALREAFGGAA